MRYSILFILFTICTLQSCYSFKGISIPNDVNTFNVVDFANRVNDAPLDIEVTFAEKLRSKVRTESRLSQTDDNPDIEFSGEITRFFVDFEAPKEGNTVDLNKLTISVQVSYLNNKKEGDTWSKNFSNFRTYSSTEDLNAIQDDLIDEIFDQITESIFNDAFTDW